MRLKAARFAGFLLTLAMLTGCESRNAHAPAIARSPREAGQRGLDYLLTSATQWQRTHGCFGCHVQGVGIMGAALARANAYSVSSSSVQELLQVVKKNNEEGRENPDASTWPRHRQPFLNPYQFTSRYHAGISLAYHDRFAAGAMQSELMERTKLVMPHQLPSGGFPEGRREDPIDQGTIMATTSCLVTLYQADPDDKVPEITESARKAFQWLENEQPNTIQDYAYKIIGLTWRLRRDHSGVVAQTAQGLKAHRNPDGGWPELRGRGSNAYATGLALYALKLAGYPVTDPVMVKGTLYLLENQLQDGSWELVNTTSRRPSRFASTMYAVVGLGGVFDQKAEEEFLSLFRGGRRQEPISILSILLYLAFPALTLMALRRLRW